MFFVLSKLAWMIAAPVTACLIVAAAGAVLLVAGARRTGRWLAAIGTAGLVIGGTMPLGALLIRPLEDRFARIETTMPPTGIVVLGGSTDQGITLGRDRVTIADAAERLTEAVILADRYPGARLVFAGGTGAMGEMVDTEAADARRLWTALGVADGRITTEDRSRNTDENVRFARRIVDPQPGQTWLLVTSAWHMPRAVALFRANGWPVTAVPVDYRTRGTAADFWPSLDIIHNLARLDLATHEWIGLAVYRLTGRTRTLLPEP